MESFCSRIGEKCCGCELCVIVCPTHAIQLEHNKEGFLYPKLDEKLCISCKQCELNCPIENSIHLQMDDLKEAYAAKASNEKICKEAASGGIATTINLLTIREGGCVYGVQYNKDYTSALYVRVTDESELKKVMGSKYIQASKNNGLIFQNVKEDLSKGLQVTFTGLPCEVAAVSRFVPASLHQNLLLVDLFCHGPTSEAVQKKAIINYETRNQSAVISYNAKDKFFGWEKTSLCVQLQNGNLIREPLYLTEFGYAFMRMARSSCYYCPYKIENSVADISLGDDWGYPQGGKMYSRDGVSAVIVHTSKGKQWWNKLERYTYFESRSYKGVLKGNPNIVKPISSAGREAYAKKFCKKGVFLPFKIQVKQVLKKVFSVKYK